MGASHRHFLLVLILLAAAISLGSRQGWAGYVSPAALADPDAANELLSPMELLPQADMARAGENGQSQPETDDTHAPSRLFSLLQKILFAAYNIVQGGMSGSSSQTDSDDDPSGSPTDYLPRPQLPPPELTGLLPPQTGAVHPFTLASFVFRPPRAA